MFLCGICTNALIHTFQISTSFCNNNNFRAKNVCSLKYSICKKICTCVDINVWPSKLCIFCENQVWNMWSNIKTYKNVHKIFIYIRLKLIFYYMCTWVIARTTKRPNCDITWAHTTKYQTYVVAFKSLLYPSSLIRLSHMTRYTKSNIKL